VISRLFRFAAYFTDQIHELRATFWSIGLLILVFMTWCALLAALGYYTAATGRKLSTPNRRP
jgi:glutathione S-transferase